MDGLMYKSTYLDGKGWERIVKQSDIAVPDLWPSRTPHWSPSAVSVHTWIA